MYTLSQAAKKTGKGKTTIHRALKSGIITATKDENGNWQIDPAELFRVFTSVPEKEGVSFPVEADGRHETLLKQQQIEYLENEIRAQRETIADLRVQRDKWQEQAHRLLISPPQAEDKQESGFWYHMKAAFAGT